MPLKPGKKNISANIRELYEANRSKPEGQKRSRDQIIAISLAESRNKPQKLNKSISNIFHLLAQKGPQNKPKPEAAVKTKVAQDAPKEDKTNVVKPASQNPDKTNIAKPASAKTRVEGRPDLNPTRTNIKPSATNDLEREYQQRKEQETDPAMRAKRDSHMKEAALALAYRNATSKDKDMRSFGKQQLREHPKEDRMRFLQSQKLLSRNKKPSTPSA